MLAVARLEPSQHRRFESTCSVVTFVVDVRLSAKRGERPQAFERLGRRDPQVIRHRRHLNRIAVGVLQRWQFRVHDSVDDLVIELADLDGALGQIRERHESAREELVAKLDDGQVP